MTAFYPPTLCHICKKDASESVHSDEAPTRFYCDECAGCDALDEAGLCDNCYAVACESAELARLRARLAELAAEYHQDGSGLLVQAGTDTVIAAAVTR
jgi:hypothetical protein